MSHMSMSEITEITEITGMYALWPPGRLCSAVRKYVIIVGDRSPAPVTMSDTHSTALRDRQIRPLPDDSQRADAIG